MLRSLKRRLPLLKEKEEAIKTEEFEKAAKVKKEQTESLEKKLDDAKKEWDTENTKTSAGCY